MNSEKPYDHREKSGNEGDVVKHVALLAALDVVLEDWEGGFFRYADTFAGYAQTVLGAEGAWRRGVGRLAYEERLDENPHTALWRRWYLPRPMLRGGIYPGSSLVATDVARHHEVAIRLALWDVSPVVIENLRTTWGDQALVFDRPAGQADPEVANAHFLFVDPPALDAWPSLKQTLAPRRDGGSLLWLPVLEDADDEVVLVDTWSLGYRRLTVRWAGPSRTVGARLVHRLPERPTAALEAAVEHVAALAGWNVTRHP